MTPEQIEANRVQLTKNIFAAAREGNKVKLKHDILSKYPTIEIMVKKNPDGSASKVRRKTIKRYIEDLGHLLTSEGESVFDLLIKNGFNSLAINVMQDDACGLMETHPFDKNKRYLNVSLHADNYLKLISAIHEEANAKDFQQRAFIRWLSYGQPISEQVDEFLAHHYEVVAEELIRFREEFGGRNI